MPKYYMLMLPFLDKHNQIIFIKLFYKEFELIIEYISMHYSSCYEIGRKIASSKTIVTAISTFNLFFFPLYAFEYFFFTFLSVSFFRSLRADLVTK